MEIVSGHSNVGDQTDQTFMCGQPRMAPWFFITNPISFAQSGWPRDYSRLGAKATLSELAVHGEPINI